MTVKFSDFGTSYFEVLDNGTGISSDAYETVVARHSTSKLEKFDDLESISTFGFRGEALAALSAISSLKISTRTKEDQIGAELEYDNYGKVTNQKRAVRKIGTTVRVDQLFHRIPVRRQIFLKNDKKEFQKAVNILMGYALMTDARILVQTQTQNSIWKTVIQTKASERYRINTPCTQIGPNIWKSAYVNL